VGIVNYKVKKSGADSFITLKDISYLLGQMPNETSIESINELNSEVSLLRTFNIRLSHPMFEDGKELIDSGEFYRGVGFNEDFSTIYTYNGSLHWNLDEICRKRK